ncbi:MAG TPA: efflux RND transporter periplasmic adaptor subunit, partial [Orrella sp.]
IFLLGLLVMTGYLLTGLFTVTDNAFVVRVQTPVSVKVPGTVLDVYVQNGQRVEEGEAVLKLDDKAYSLALANAQAQVDSARAGIDVLRKQVELAGFEVAAAQDNLALLQYELAQKSSAKVRSAVPQIEVKQLEFEVRAQENQVLALKASQERDRLAIKQAEMQLIGLRALRDEALLALEDTVVRAKTSGVVENQFMARGQEVVPGQTLFTVAPDGKIYVQANFNETDLAGVKPGDKVSIYPRTYLWDKSFEGVVVSQPFGVDRQITPPLMAEQVVLSQNRWLQLPQRLPLLIEITNPDQNTYPLQSGMSAYVHVHD